MPPASSFSGTFSAVCTRICPYRVFVLWVTVICASFWLIDYSCPSVTRLTDIADAGDISFQEQPYPVKSDSESSRKPALVFFVQYKLGQNTQFTIDPVDEDYGQKTCVTSVSLFPEEKKAGPPVLISKENICAAKTLDLAPYLHEGTVRLVLHLQVPAEESRFYVSPKLWGGNAGTTTGCMGFFISAAALLYALCRHFRLGSWSGHILALSLLYNVYWLVLQPNLIYTPDVHGHINFVLYMLHNWKSPYSYNGHESFHPFTYYLVASRFLSWFMGSWILNPVSILRIFSLMLYMICCLYGLRTLRLVMPYEGIPYYVGACLIAFWPVGITIATSVSNDLAVDASWAATYFYLTRWLKEGRALDLRIVIGFLGVTFMMKGSVWTLVAIVGAGIFYAMFTKRWSWRWLWHKHTLIAMEILLCGMAINVGRILYDILFYGRNTSTTYFGGAREDVYPLSYYLNFDLPSFWKNPFVIFKSEPSFLNYFLKTMLYSPWGRIFNIGIWANVLNMLLLAFLVLAFLMALPQLRRCAEADRIVPHLLAFILGVLGIVGFLLAERYHHCQNFRYVFPTMIPLSIAYVCGLEKMRLSLWGRPVYWVGLTVSILLISGTIIFYLAPLWHI